MVMIESFSDAQDIKLTSTIKVVSTENRGASVIIPAEIRLTEQLIGLINNSLTAQNLKLEHMDIAEVHKEDLKGLPNVVLDEGAEEE